MAYHLYHTEGIVLGSIPVKESNRFYFILTRDMGLIGAAAQGVRELKSKLRGHLTEYMPANMTFVRGRDVWRLTAAEECGVLVGGTDAAHRRAVIRLAVLLRRLLQGEEEHEELYDEVKVAFAFLHETQTPLEFLPAGEVLAAARILALMGYLAPFTQEAELFTAPWGSELLLRAVPARGSLVKQVNAALQASQL